MVKKKTSDKRKVKSDKFEEKLGTVERKEKGLKKDSEKMDKAGVVKDIADKLLELMETKATCEVVDDKENEALLVEIQTEDEAGLLIGNHGQTLESIQAILGLMCQKELGEWQRILVNISGWREKEEERLINLAKQVAERAKASGEPQSLYNLNSSQRRIVHLALAEDEEIKTESVGEGRDRYLVITSKK